MSFYDTLKSFPLSRPARMLNSNSSISAMEHLRAGFDRDLGDRSTDDIYFLVIHRCEMVQVMRQKDASERLGCTLG